MKLNADLPSNPDDVEDHVQRTINSQPLHLLHHAASTGWRADVSAFVALHKAIDSKDRRQKILPPTASTIRSCAAGNPRATCQGG